jgi:hypothetical protein
MFAICAASILFTGTFFEGDAAKAFYIVGGILSGATLISFFVMVFNNMVCHAELKKKINKHSRIKANIKIEEDALTEIKTEFTDYFTKLYPEHEKDIFSKISPGDAEQLTMYLAKYPELKFSGMINTLVAKVSDQMKRINAEKLELEECKTDILDMNQSNWLLFKVKAIL